MFIWIFLVVIAQFINAIVVIVDKFIVTSQIVARPVTYALYVSLLSVFAVFAFLFSWVPIPLEGVAIPSIANVEGPDIAVISISLLAGFAFLFSLINLFSALKRADASDVVPVVGAMSAVGALLLSFLLLDASLTQNFFWGFSLLVLGTFFISLFRFKIKTLLFSITSGFLFAVHFVCLKVLFEITHFDDAFFWSRVGIVVPALLIAMLPWVHIFSNKKRPDEKSTVSRKKMFGFILGNKFLAGIAGLMILKAIELGDVTIVQALGGLQFAFLLLIPVFRGSTLPEACGEECSRRDVYRKFVSVGIIILGFVILFL